MATRESSSSRQRAKKRPGGRASSGTPPKARARSAEAHAENAQQQLAQGLQSVLLAGMGALARAQKEGPAAFQDAAIEGFRLLNQSRSAAQRMVRDAFESAQLTLHSRVGGAREQAHETLDNLESLFQSRVQRAMHQLGVPTAEEIRALTRRVGELNDNVRQISARKRVKKTAGAKRRVAAQKPKRSRKAPPPAPPAEEMT